MQKADAHHHARAPPDDLSLPFGAIDANVDAGFSATTVPASKRPKGRTSQPLRAGSFQRAPKRCAAREPPLAPCVILRRAAPQ